VSLLVLPLCDEPQIQPTAEEHSDSVPATHGLLYLSENEEYNYENLSFDDSKLGFMTKANSLQIT
jgi:hypothetical protein